MAVWDACAMSKAQGVVSVLVALGVATLFSACGSDDPRCVSLCTVKEPSTPGVGDVCSEASASSCRQECGAQIEGVSNVCAGCLLEDARFEVSSEGFSGDCQTSSMCAGSELLCTESGPGGDCQYCDGDKAAYDACYKKVHPRREIECEVRFRDPAECADICSLE